MKLLINILIHVFSTKVIGQQYPCIAADGSVGTCKSLYHCQDLLTIANNPYKSLLDMDLLRLSHCGFDSTGWAAVCCPGRGVYVPKFTTSSQCFTPDGKPGHCKGLQYCPHLANLVRPQHETIKYLQTSRCTNSPDEYSVCCESVPSIPENKEVSPVTSITVGKEIYPGTSFSVDNEVSPVKSILVDKDMSPAISLSTNKVAPTVQRKGKCASSVSAFPPDPKSECCGIDATAGNKIVGGVQNAIDEHPWLAVIEFNKDAVIEVKCSGGLISGKYVLTAAHCVTGPVLKLGTPTNILLGEYDTSYEGFDCVPAEAGGEDCTEGVTKIAIEKTIPHPEYDPTNPLRRNDIALIKMAEMAPYTDFIRPICLPKEDVTLKTEGFNLIAAGWGSINTSPNSSTITTVKSDVQLPFVNITECQESYKAPRRNVTLWKGQICAGGEKGKDSCKGDSGGPLMYKKGKNFEVAGVISFGPVPCGLEDVPAVYTNVYEYDSWIRSNIVP